MLRGDNASHLCARMGGLSQIVLLLASLFNIVKQRMVNIFVATKNTNRRIINYLG